MTMLSTKHNDDYDAVISSEKACLKLVNSA